MVLAEAGAETSTGLPRRNSFGLGPNLLPNGNLRCMTALAQCDAGAAKTVAWTSFNMVSSVQQGTTNVSLLYDPEHSRIQQTAPEGVTQYLNDPANGVMTERFAPTGGGLYWRSYIQADGHIVAERSVKGSAVTVRYFTTDHLGSTIALTDETGHLAESDAYDAWGKARDATTGADDPTCSKPGQSFTTRGFSGHEEMADLCLVNMNARIYDPAIGRFMSPDDIIPDAFNGQSYNRYSYVDNNPLSYIDPTGHMVACTGSCFNYNWAVNNNDSCAEGCGQADWAVAFNAGLAKDAISHAGSDLEAGGYVPSGLKINSNGTAIAHGILSSLLGENGGPQSQDSKAAAGIDAHNAAVGDNFMPVTVEGIQLSKSELYKRFWAVLANAAGARGLRANITYTFDPSYMVANDIRTGDTENIYNEKALGTREEADEFVSSHKDWYDELGRPKWATPTEVGGLKGGVVIFANAVDPSSLDYNVQFAAGNGHSALNVRLTSWQEVGINTLFHEEYHVEEYPSADYQDEYRARVYSLKHMSPGGFP